MPALWDLVWAGEVTNDAWTPLRAGRRYGVPAPGAPPAPLLRRRSTGITATQGRWSLTHRLFGHAPGPGPGTGPDRRALAELLLERQGIVTRDGVRGEGIVGGYSAVYGELKALETLGLSRRGYFVEGLGGAQFALGGAVERLRELRPEDGRGVGMRSCSPRPIPPSRTEPPCPGRSCPAAGPPGWRVRTSSSSGARPRSSWSAAGARSSRSATPNEEWLKPALAALVQHVKTKRGQRLAVERFDGEPVADTELMPLLLEAGFLAGPRRAVLRP